MIATLGCAVAEEVRLASSRRWFSVAGWTGAGERSMLCAPFSIARLQTRPTGPTLTVPAVESSILRASEPATE